MKTVRFRCPHCGRKIEADARGAGLEIRCPECVLPVFVPDRNRILRTEPPLPSDDLPLPPPPTVVVALSPRQVLRMYLPVIGAWLCIAGAAAATARSELFTVVAIALLVAAFGLGVVAMARRMRAQGALIVGWTLCAIALMPAPRTAAPAAAVRPGATTAPAKASSVAPPAEPGGPPPEEPVEVLEYAEDRLAAVAPAEPAPAAPLPAAAPVAPPVEAPAAAPEKPEDGLPFKVYGDCGDGIEPYCPSGWMGKFDAVRMEDCWEKNPHSGRTCIRAAYTGQTGWAGVVWQNPPNNWGDDSGGYDLTGATQLCFWARGEKGGEVVEFKMGFVGRNKPHWDTARAGTGKVKLGREWKQYSVRLAGKDLSRVMTAFAWIAEGGKTPTVFYLDDIRYE